MVHYFKFTLAIFNFNCLTLKLIEKMRFLYFSNNSISYNNQVCTILTPFLKRISSRKTELIAQDVVMTVLYTTSFYTFENHLKICEITWGPTDD